MGKKNSEPGYSTLNVLLARIERLFLFVIIGLVPPIFLGLAGWWGSIPFVGEERIQYFALGGFLAGILVGLLFLRRWTNKALKVSILWPSAVYLLYSVGILGFFMGVPVFNLFLGLVWGYYMGMRIRAAGAEKSAVAKLAHQSGLFTAVVMGIACLSAIGIASLDPSLEASIQGMFGFAKPIERSMIMGLSTIGGVVLVGLEYLLTRAVVKFSSFQ